MMDKKIKLIIIGLGSLLLIILIVATGAISGKQVAERERDELKRENVLLNQKAEEDLRSSRRLEEKAGVLSQDLTKAIAERLDLEKRFDLANKEKIDLIERLKEQKKILADLLEQQQKQKEEQQKQKTQVLAQQQVASPMSADSAYWAGVLRTKTELELKLDALRVDLNNLQKANVELQKSRSALETQVSELTRQRGDLERQFDSQQKRGQEIIDKLSLELVNEKNDKIKLSEETKPINVENENLRQQIANLAALKADLEKKLSEAENSLVKLQSENVSKEKSLTQTQVLPSVSETAIELPPIVVRPQAQVATEDPLATSAGKVITVNKESNFAVIDLGDDAGVKAGDTFQVLRDEKVVAIIEVIKTRKNISACDIKKEDSPIRVGDIIR